ncbi:Type II secretory pathway ATPase GspE/PulE or T4P pilus assembly pathway ATPase PilB [Geoalkalibacter ferrihydriticus]|uniref:Secretion system protein E n=2 Tax=Geoalkalibacter ferrihydriticus TaxID=392333 RepID=A0A0C2HTR6_9BACT|nr:ATPase, T2SS/T4P/T4SS family [Geoalkalibacter ferrihydriticus]KIH76237.1 secretion system protein E [Geoalkalibacter ferrihydriticus DSM 17813]SDL25346.1 Type II secretory pathway ATPase GspE/PulE or T4P pilus assembly pathway ATPase PilB [Geoalkalibacter ferrihydriticus]
MAKFAELFRSLDPETQADAKAQPQEPSGEQERFTLLLVDDEPGVLRALQRIFMDENYHILIASDAHRALELLSANQVHLIVSDHRMPGLTGAELLRQVKERWPRIIRIMLTGYADVQSIMGAVNEGAVFKFITKPWNDEDLRLTVSLGLQQYVLIRENRRLRELTRSQQEKLKSAAPLLTENRGILGTVLEKAGLVDRAEFQRAQRELAPDEFIIEALERLAIVKETKVARALQHHLSLEFVDLKEIPVARDVARFLPRDLCLKNRLLPLRLEDNRLTLAMADPSDFYKCDNIALMTGLKVQPVVALSSDIARRLNDVWQEGAELSDVFGDIPDIEPMDEVDIIIEEDDVDINVQELLDSSEIPPIIRIVNAIISEAVRYRASDIHIEPKTRCSIVRYRIDGILHSKIKIPADLHPATVSRVKIMARLDIAERRKPQDGRITVRAGTRLVDIRVSTMPTISGEKLVMRVLDKNAAILNLEDLGLLPAARDQLRRVIRKPQGIFVATGPTGSGKTTLLYSVLKEMMQSTKNFETIEDPVEYFLEEANQVFVHERIGVSFASILRSTMRQDPDVILVGEIRDLETADVAFKAALTGHMVLTTLHTNNAIASITRLIDLGIKPYLIASALEGIVAQRLVRRICPHCRVAEDPDPEALELLRIPAAHLAGRNMRGRGCARCNNTGYAGRVGIYEIFTMNEDFRHFICENYKEGELLEMARGGGMRLLIDDGIEKVHQGATTLEELLRVVGPQIRHERTCSHCERRIEARFAFCPYCGHFRQEICVRCRLPQESDWLVCAFCGEKRAGSAAGASLETLKPRSLS